jgi:DNA-binding NtrC family response regulator
VREGRFREDLFYRLNVLRIQVPPLRERKEDLPLLCGALLERIRERLGARRLAIAPEALEKLGRLSFPGNIRELENILERAAIYARDETIRPEDIDARMPEEKDPPPVGPGGSREAGNGADDCPSAGTFDAAGAQIPQEPSGISSPRPGRTAGTAPTRPRSGHRQTDALVQDQGIRTL